MTANHRFISGLSVQGRCPSGLLVCRGFWIADWRNTGSGAGIEVAFTLDGMLPLLLALQMLAVAQTVDSSVLAQPTATITADDRKHLDRGEPVAHVLPARGLEVAIIAAVPVCIDADRLVAWIREIEQLKKSSYVLAIHRFSNPPRLQDLDSVTLDDSDLDAIRGCRRGDCGLKMSADELRGLQEAGAGGGERWREAIQQRFRQVMLDRADAYVASGHKRSPDTESFLYWSKERLARKAVISITDVSIVRGRGAEQPDVLIAGKEIFATHYINASLGVTTLVRGQAGTNYLVYVNRSEVDALGGFFGGLARFVIEGRLKAESVDVLQGLRRRLESGEPPTR